MSVLLLGGLAIAVVMVVGCVSQPAAPATTASEPTTRTTVLALQAFFDEASEARLRAAWDEALKLPATTCALTLGARPHMTFGSWNIVPSRIPEAVEKLRAAQKRLADHTMQVVVAEWRPGNFFLQPAAPADPGLVDWHRATHETIAFPYEHFRPGDIPGQWEPHITMFNCTPENAAAGRRIAERVAQGGPLTVARFGLVTFGPIREQCVVETAR